ncbi:hypothetical protein B2J88_47805 [Rhodococcus sp. SRB_17]|nr:hypothetical protein [Rhodococcus sp. SRB_17]
MLWSRALDECAFPQCSQKLTVETVDATTGEVRTNPIGEQAHIRSARPSGPRHDPTFGGDIDGYDNLVLLCPTHHTRVDANGGAEFTVETLVDMRKAHEKQVQRRDEIDTTIKMYIAQQYGVDDRVLFEQVDLTGPSVDSMFIDVPFACRADAAVAPLMRRIAEEAPGDVDSNDNADGHVVTGAAQALLHPDWKGSALLVGGPGQGKSTLLQYVCQFHRAKMLGRDAYNGQEQHLGSLTDLQRVAIRLDLRKYTLWAAYEADAKTKKGSGGKGNKKRAKNRIDQSADEPRWPTIEEYIVAEIAELSGGRGFSLQDLALLVSTRPVLIALDGLDEVANLVHRERVSSQIVDTQHRLEIDAVNLVVLVATRPGATTSALWSANSFPWLALRRLTQGLRLQYLQRWAKVANLTEEATDKLQRTFMENQNVPHIHELASYPMQLAILLHLLQRRQLLPQRRTELYSEYLKTFLDREQSGDKEPLLAEERQVVEDIHAYIGWHIHTRVEEATTSGSIKRDALMELIHDYVRDREDGRELADKLFSAFTTRVLCLVERDAGSFQFEVQSLREYFAATYIFDETDRDKRDDCLVALLKRPYWSNVCRFLVGKYSKGEIRGMRSVLQELSKQKDLGLHPLIRATATLFLNDRTYEGQKEEPVQEIVDFILGGPGVVLAEDGLLESGGTGLRLSERAGRSQAVRNLKARLEQELDADTRAAAASSLRRHVIADDDLSGWWWARCDGTNSWLDTASQLRLLDDLDSSTEEQLPALLDSYDSGSTWVTQLLVDGGYRRAHDEVLLIVRDEINDGAVEVIQANDSSPIGRMLTSARVVMLRPAKGNVVHDRASDDGLLGSAISTAQSLRNEVYGDADTATDWGRRLTRIEQTWGDGWVLRQSISALPLGAPLETIALLSEALHDSLMTESDTRALRRDADWWRQQLAGPADGLILRHSLFSLLTKAFPPVLTALAGDLSREVDALSPRHSRALRRALRAYQTNPAVSRELTLHDVLRLNQASFSARTLWLIREVATPATVDQIDKRLAGSVKELLTTETGDLREMVRFSGETKVVKFEAFHGHRSSLPAGGWSSNIKLGALRQQLAEGVLRAPQEWPSDLVQRAVEKTEERMLSSLGPLRHEAERDSWFN